MEIKTMVAIGTGVGLGSAILANQVWVAVTLFLAYVAWMFLRPNTRGRMQ